MKLFSNILYYKRGLSTLPPKKRKIKNWTGAANIISLKLPLLSVIGKIYYTKLASCAMFCVVFFTFLLIQKNQIALLAFGKSRKETGSMEDVQVPHAITLDQGLN